MSDDILSRATPLTWRKYPGAHTDTTIVGPRDETIARCVAEYGSANDAALIVQAVNERAGHVAALREIYENGKALALRQKAANVKWWRETAKLRDAAKSALSAAPSPEPSEAEKAGRTLAIAAEKFISANPDQGWFDPCDVIEILGKRAP